MTNRLSLLAVASLVSLSACDADSGSDAAVAVVESFYVALDAGDKETLEELVAPDFVDHNRSAATSPEVSDRDGALGLFGALAAGFPDQAHELEFVDATGSGKVVAYWRFTGTNTGTLFGAPATGNAVDVAGIDIFRVIDGTIAEQWHVEDFATLNAQLSE